MQTATARKFELLPSQFERSDLRDKIVLIPEMERLSSLLLAAAFRSFGMHARVMETCKGLELGKRCTSGKECYPCQITTGDILYTMQEEKHQLGDAFDAEKYVYFLPEAGGPCRFGMYNKYQRIVLDSMPDLNKVKIVSITTDDSYNFNGLVDQKDVLQLRKWSFFAIVVGDVLNRLLWRVRPYERESGATEKLIEKSLQSLQENFQVKEKRSQKTILQALIKTVEQAKELIDPHIKRKPLIGVVGEIYLRSHLQANQDLIKTLEKYGAEVVNASMAEWLNYVTYDALRETQIAWRFSFKRFDFKSLLRNTRKAAAEYLTLGYQQYQQRKVYKCVRAILDLADDHKISELEKEFRSNSCFSFDIRTESCLSVATILHAAKGHCNGVVNVYPLSCMPGTTTAAIVKPLAAKMQIPYLDAAYDDSLQSGREAAIRTFVYQSEQHYRKHGRH